MEFYFDSANRDSSGDSRIISRIAWQLDPFLIHLVWNCYPLGVCFAAVPVAFVYDETYVESNPRVSPFYSCRWQRHAFLAAQPQDPSQADAFLEWGAQHVATNGQPAAAASGQSAHLDPDE